MTAATPSQPAPHAGQFLLARQPDARLDAFRAKHGWRRIAFAGGVFDHHPALTVTRAADAERAMLVAGDIVDSDDGDASNDAIAAGLVRTCRSAAELEPRLDRLGGRWVMVAAFADELFVYHDAGALKSVCVNLRRAPIAVGSQPGLFAEIDGLPENRERVAQIERANAPAWPIFTSPYDGIWMLPPNHRVDLTRGRVERYWPRHGLSRRGRDDAAAEIFSATATLLKGMAARRRCHLGLTAGYDSRLLAACARDLCDQTHLFTMTGRPGRADAPTATSDEVVPPRVARALNSRHTRARFTASLPPETRRTLSANCAGMYRDQAIRKTAAYARVAGDGVILQALGGELLRTFYTGDPGANATDAAGIAARTEFRDVPFAMEGLRTWLDTVPDAGIDPLTLLYWEQRLGIWGGLGLTCREALVEIWSPLTCRRTLQAALEAPAADRQPPYPLVRRAIALGEPALLDIPFNTCRRDRVQRALPLPWRAKRFLGWH